jgi:xylulokinase
VTLVAGVDSSTQSCKVVVCDADTGRVVRSGSAPHPDGTEVDPDAWYDAFLTAARDAGGLLDVAALAVGAQQHGAVLLDEGGATVRPALLWNDTRSAPQAAALVTELGAHAWADAVGSVPVASFTVTKLRWVAEHEPEAAARTACVCLPHDWLTWRLAGGGPGGDPAVRPVTDRGDASGTGYWSPSDARYLDALVQQAFGRRPELPAVVGPSEPAGAVGADPRLRDLLGPGTLLAAGTGDNMATALALGVGPGEVVVSIGTSGTAFAVAEQGCADPRGEVAGFADATGRFLPLVCTLNAARVLDVAARLLAVGHDELDRLALAAPAGADGIGLVPYLDGERTPNLPDATGTVDGLTTRNATRENLARAFVEGMLGGLRAAVDALRRVDTPADRVLLVGGGARSAAVRAVAADVLALPVVLPEPREYVALGAARQAAWALTGTLPAWDASRSPGPQ